MRLVLLVVLTSVTCCGAQPPSNDTVSCYTCDNICAPNNKMWNVTQCNGSCRIEFMKLPGDCIENPIGGGSCWARRAVAAHF